MSPKKTNKGGANSPKKRRVKRFVNIYRYTDYKKFLNDYYQNRKKADPAFSYMKLAEEVGFRARAYIHRVFTGQSELSKKRAKKLARAMYLPKKDSEYFIELVNLNLAKTSAQRERYFERIQSFRKEKDARIIRENHFSYFSKWHHAAIREMVTMVDFKEDYEMLGKLLSPSISESRARKSVKLLLNLKLIRRLPSGRYIQTRASITTGDDFVKSIAVAAFQKENMRLAAESIDRHARSVRDVSTLTAGVSGSGFQKIREEIRKFRDRLVDIIEKDEDPDRVYQINFQAFPVSRLKKTE